MDSQVTVRFFTVVPGAAGQPSFEACLKKLNELSATGNPARVIDDVAVQATNLKIAGERISGDMVRIQDENLPSLVKTRGVKPEKLELIAGAGLGHHSAFLYDAEIHVLAYQMARNAVPLGLFNTYIAAACECEKFGFLPVIHASELKQLNKLKPKTLLVKVADPDALEAIEDDQRKLRRSLQNLRSLAEGVYVKVQIGLANNKGQLDRSVVGGLVTWLLEQRDAKRGKVGMIQVVGKDFSEGEVALDFLRSPIGESRRLTLGKAGQDENYKTRAKFVLDAMEKHYAELKKFKPKER